MNTVVTDFLKTEKLSVMSIVLADGSVHSATLYFSHADKPVKIFVSTSKDSLKASTLISGESQKAGLVVGFSETGWITLQMHGSVRMVSAESEILDIQKIHFAKLPDAEKRMKPTTIFLEFVPEWFRYTNFTTSPITIIS